VIAGRPAEAGLLTGKVLLHLRAPDASVSPGR
jgi:hypothetical protein